MKSSKLVIAGIALFITIAAVFLGLFEYRSDEAGGSGWQFRYSHQK